MRAYKRWDASGTISYVTVIGERPADAETSLVYHEFPDGASTILDPVALLIRHADGTEERVEIEDVAVAEKGVLDR